MAIQRLSDGLINRIAAGEVIDRPAGAVKELVENALDAGASSISVAIEDGGKGLIRVKDDGVGMSPDDLALAVERHTTSKLTDENLTGVLTHGFRGEALPSIGAVSRLRIVSCLHDPGAQGFAIDVEGGEVAPPRPHAALPGTTVAIGDLFFATPARLAFLKSERSEAAATLTIMRSLALAYDRVSFRLFRNDRCVLDAPAVAADLDPEARLRKRIHDVLGAEFADNGVPFSLTRDGMRVFGSAGLPTFNHANGLHQYLFVNRRIVRDKLLMAATRVAYGDLLARHRYPALAMFVEVEPREIDANVHPAKTEIRFRDPSRMRALATAALREALFEGSQRSATTASRDMLAAARPAAVAAGSAAPPGGSPTADRHPSSPSAFSSSFPSPSPSSSPSSPSSSLSGGRRPIASSGRGGHSGRMGELLPLRETASGSSFSPSEAASAGDEPALHSPLGVARGQLHETYIIAQTADGVVLVDQHAAHERILYEKMKAGLARNGVPRQILLIPVFVDLEEAAVERVMSRADEFLQLGFAIEAYGASAAVVREAPSLLGKADLAAMVKDLADDLAELGEDDTLGVRLREICSTLACHSAIRAGARLDAAAMNALLREMEETPHSGQCNHGRPTHIVLKLADIERLFGR